LIQLVADDVQDVIQERRAAPVPKVDGPVSRQQWPGYDDKRTLFRILKDGPANIMKLWFPPGRVWNLDALEKIPEWPLEVPKRPLYEIAGGLKWEVCHLQALWKMVRMFLDTWL